MELDDVTKVTLVIVLTVGALAVMVFFIAVRSGPTDVWDIPALQFVSGTEYNIGEQGQVITEARYLNGTSALQNCTFAIWYPAKTLFADGNGTLSTSGNQYLAFIVPNATGVYEYQAQCTYDNGRFGVISKSFHVSEFQNDTSTKLNRVRAVMIK
jgi:uncharacterized protein YfaS (alpha-2-macroglobulin family)